MEEIKTYIEETQPEEIFLTNEQIDEFSKFIEKLGYTIELDKLHNAKRMITSYCALSDYEKGVTVGELTGRNK